MCEGLIETNLYVFAKANFRGLISVASRDRAWLRRPRMDASLAGMHVAQRARDGETRSPLLATRRFFCLCDVPEIIKNKITTPRKCLHSWPEFGLRDGRAPTKATHACTSSPHSEDTGALIIRRHQTRTPLLEFPAPDEPSADCCCCSPSPPVPRTVSRILYFSWSAFRSDLRVSRLLLS